MALIGDGTIGSGTIGSPQDRGEPVILDVSTSISGGYADIGDVVELIGKFSSPRTAEALSPQSVVLTVLLPSGATVAPEVDSEEEGAYVGFFEPEEPGRHLFAFDGAGEYQASEERSFRVRERRVPRG